MPNAPTTIDRAPVAGPPAHLPAATERAFRACVGRLQPPASASVTHYAISASDAPSASLRQALTIRRGVLDAALSPAGPALATAEYKGLLASMAASSATSEMAVRELQNFVEAAQAVPGFALKAACASFRNGKIGDGKWMPKVGEVVREATRLVAEVAKERREVNSVLTAEVTAPVANPARKAKLLTDALAFVSEGREMDRTSGMTKRSPEAEREAKVHAEAIRLFLDHGTPDTRPMPPLSPYLRKQLGLGEVMHDMVPDLAPRDYDAA